jgi:hypothetical protein
MFKIFVFFESAYFQIKYFWNLKKEKINRKEKEKEKEKKKELKGKYKI